jgi:uncharacterized membrane protein
MSVKEFLQGTWFKHPLHPMLVHIPTALWPAALLFDILTTLGIGGNALVRTSFYAILFGLLVTVLAVPTGIADWWDIKKEKPAWKLGLYHMALNLVAAVIWAINLALRGGPALEAASVATLPLILSMVGTLLLFVSGYLGGRMIYDHGTSIARLSKEKWRQIAQAGGARLPSE